VNIRYKIRVKQPPPSPKKCSNLRSRVYVYAHSLRPVDPKYSEKRQILRSRVGIDLIFEK
jgi:hypothetical protein